jgi:transcription termination/antitermination factor nusG
MSKEWYILHTYAGYERKIEQAIRVLLERGSLSSDVITDLSIPEETVTSTTKSGKKKESKKVFLPGYLLVEMDLPELGWREICSKLKRIPGVSGFLGTVGGNTRPIPISTDEAKEILQKTGEIKSDKSSSMSRVYSIGDKVKITEGPFGSFSGTVGEIMPDKNKLRIMVTIFGRITPVEVDVSQVELI